jgi:hypothetical protein
MRRSIFSFVILAAAVAAAGCSRPSESAPPAPKTSAMPQAAPVSAPAPSSTPAPAPAAAAVTLPEGFAKNFHVHPEMKVTGVETTDAAKAQYKVMGELRASAKDVMDYYVKYFQEHGWEEDAVMENKGYTVVSFKKDGYLEYVDAHEGGLGVVITISTGRE